MEMEKPKRYEIDTLEKLINTASLENFDRISPDFLLWLHYTLTVIDSIRKKNPKKFKNLSNYKVLKSSFIWVDDGKNELTHFIAKNTDTGEITEIKVKPNTE